jgi:hypothetical protein
MPTYRPTRSLHRRTHRRVRAYPGGNRSITGPIAGQCFDIAITRDGGWWMIHIPEIDGMTRAHRRAEVELMARECIAVRTGIPLGYITVRVTDEG